MLLHILCLAFKNCGVWSGVGTSTALWIYRTAVRFLSVATYWHRHCLGSVQCSPWMSYKSSQFIETNKYTTPFIHADQKPPPLPWSHVAALGHSHATLFLSRYLSTCLLINVTVLASTTSSVSLFQMTTSFSTNKNCLSGLLQIYPPLAYSDYLSVYALHHFVILYFYLQWE